MAYNDLPMEAKLAIAFDKKAQREYISSQGAIDVARINAEAANYGDAERTGASRFGSALQARTAAFTAQYGARSDKELARIAGTNRIDVANIEAQSRKDIAKTEADMRKEASISQADLTKAVQSLYPKSSQEGTELATPVTPTRKAVAKAKQLRQRKRIINLDTAGSILAQPG